MSRFQVVEHQESLVRTAIAVRQNPLIVLDFEDETSDFATSALTQFGQLLDDLRLAHGQNLLLVSSLRKHHLQVTPSPLFLALRSLSERCDPPYGTILIKSVREDAHEVKPHSS